MADNDMQTELEQLRAEVAALSATRASKQAANAQEDTTSVDNQSAETDEVNSVIESAQAAIESDAELEGQFDELFKKLEHEIEDLPAITTLAVFSLGVLFGRLLR